MVYAVHLRVCDEKNMKILLLRPKPHRETIGLQSVMVCEPLELMTLMGVLLENGHEPVLADMILEGKPLESILREARPEMVAMTGYISHINVIKDYARRIKAFDPAIEVGVGGVHAEVCPEDFKSPFIDRVYRGAGELYARLGCGLTEGILPFRDLPERYRKKYYYLFQENCALIKTSLGCPYSCNFCFCKEISPYAPRPVDQVIRELLSIPQKEVYIVDDDFLFDRERLSAFARGLSAHGIKKHFLCYGRADFIAENEDLIALLAENGLRAVIVGVEASDQDQLDAYAKGSTVGDNEKALAVLRSHGIECYATVILGVDWTRDDFARLYRFVRDNHLYFVNLQPLTPMPGTPYFGEYRDKLLIPYEAHEKWDMAHLVVSPTGLGVRQYYVEILKLYYKITLRPESIRHMLRRYGLRTCMKLSRGAGAISWQYVLKILRGDRP
jgi:radical SAM superfamily enzyme YgiQ (UPF0313 family)